MPFIGNQLSTSFQNVETQTITGDGSTGYTLNNPVADGKDLLVYINNVKQEEGSGKAYTATGTTITFSDAVASTDSCYVVFIGQAIGTVTPKDGSIVSSMLADANLEMPNTLDLNGKELILDADGDSSITSDTDDEIHIKIAGADDFKFKANTLEVQTGSNIDMNGTELILDADADTSITSDTDDRIDFKTGGTDRMHLVTEKLGLGTSSPGEILHLKTTADADLGLKVENDDSQAFVKVQSGGTTLFGGNAGVNLVSGSSFATAIHINSSQNVGIGTTSPQRALSIGTHGSTSSAEIAFGTTTTGNASLLFGDSTSGTALYDGYIQYQHDGNNMLFATGGGSERMRIDSSGNVLIGTTSTSAATAQGIILNPSSGLHMNNSTSSAGISLILLYSSHSTTDQTKFEVTSEGNVKSRTNSYGAFSDERLKEQIVDASSQWDDIKAIEIKNFKFISNLDDADNPKMLGVIAQQVEKVSPNLVEIDPKDEMKTVKYSLLYLKAVKALQEAMARIEALEAKVTALEAK